MIVCPAAKKSRSRSFLSSVQLAVLLLLSVTEKAAARAVCKSLGMDTPLPAVTVAEAAPVIVRLASSASAKVIVPLSLSAWAEASAASLMLGSTACVLMVGALLDTPSTLIVSVANVL